MKRAVPSLDASRFATLPAAMLLASSAGLLDATVYLGHGHVFANAMTGNVILMGIAAIGRDWAQVARHMDVLGGFLLGVAASEAIRSRPPHLAGRFTLALEIVSLALLAGFVDRIPLLLLLAVLAFVSAFQTAAFRRIGPFSYNSTFLTGNLRDVVEAAVDCRTAPDPADRFRARNKAVDLGLICTAFLAGALVGAELEKLVPRHALWFAEIPLVLVMAIALLARRSQQ